MNIDRTGCRRERLICRAGILKHAETLFDALVCRIELCRPRVRIDRIGDLVVARLVQASQVVPDLADIRVKADRARVRVESISVLVDLVVEHTDGAPERRISAISVDGLLIRLVGLVVSLTCHEGTTEEIPALSIAPV